MNFRPELAAAVMRGEKTVTRRATSENPRSPWWREKCALQVDRSYAVCPGRGKNQIGRIRIVRVWRELFNPAAIDDVEAAREGFASAAEFADTWESLHGDLAPVECWRIEFKIDNEEATDGL